jgi:hypothetical protein
VPTFSFVELALGIVARKVECAHKFGGDANWVGGRLGKLATRRMKPAVRATWEGGAPSTQHSTQQTRPKLSHDVSRHTANDETGYLKTIDEA